MPPHVSLYLQGASFFSPVSPSSPDSLASPPPAHTCTPAPLMSTHTHTRPAHGHTRTPAPLMSTHLHTHFQVNLGPLVTETSHAGQVSIPAGPLKGASSPAGLLKDLLEEAVATGREQWPLFSWSHVCKGEKGQEPPSPLHTPTGDKERAGP